MSDDQRKISAIQKHGRKKQRKGNSRYDLRIDDGDLRCCLQRFCDFAAAVKNADGAGRAENGRQRGRRKREPYGIKQNLHDFGVAKQLTVKRERKAFPSADHVGRGKTVYDEQ